MSTSPIYVCGSPSKNKTSYIVDMILKGIINQRSSTRPNLVEPEDNNNNDNNNNSNNVNMQNLPGVLSRLPLAIMQ
jgi:hypothetical protein